jgi:lipoate-protein ligase A
MNKSFQLKQKEFLLVDDPFPHSGLFNMEFDKWLFDLSRKKKILPVFRLYSWCEPTLTTGRFHKIENDIDMTKCRDDGIPVIKRPTGGRAILHQIDEVTISFIIPRYAISPYNFRNVFFFVAKNLCQGFNHLKIKALINQTPTHYENSPLCFQSVSQYEVVDTGGHKLVGLAQLFKKESSLIQGSIPLKGQDNKRALFKKRGSFINDIIKKEFPVKKVRQALIKGFSDIRFRSFF